MQSAFAYPPPSCIEGLVILCAYPASNPNAERIDPTPLA